MSRLIGRKEVNLNSEPETETGRKASEMTFAHWLGAGGDIEAPRVPLE